MKTDIYSPLSRIFFFNEDPLYFLYHFCRRNLCVVDFFSSLLDIFRIGGFALNLNQISIWLFRFVKTYIPLLFECHRVFVIVECWFYSWFYWSTIQQANGKANKSTLRHIDKQAQLYTSTKAWRTLNEKAQLIARMEMDFTRRFAGKALYVQCCKVVLKINKICTT